MSGDAHVLLCTVPHLEAELLKFHAKSGNHLLNRTHLIVAGDDLLQRCKAVQKVLLWDPKFNILMDVGPAREENHEEATSVVSLSLSLSCSPLSVQKLWPCYSPCWEQFPGGILSPHHVTHQKEKRIYSWTRRQDVTINGILLSWAIPWASLLAMSRCVLHTPWWCRWV